MFNANNYGYYNPRYSQPMYQQPITEQPVNNTYKLNGKQVESIEVVKAMDIPLDGSISYFPITDGSAIATKQLQNDGTSKTLIYKLVENSDIKKTNYATMDDLTKAIDKIDLSDIDDLKDEIKDIRKELKDLKKKA